MSDLAPDHFPGHPPVRAPGNDSDGFERGNATLIEQWAAVEDAARVVAAHGTSADPRPAAHCLWREYQRGRAATLREAALATRG